MLAFDFFLVPPLLTFAVGDTQYLITFAALFIVGAVISTLVARARRHTETLKTREAQTTTLYSLSKDLASAVGLQDILKVIIHHVGDTLNARLAILLPEGESLKMEAGFPGFSVGEKEKSVAIWAFRNGQMAGWGTETLSSAELWYVPLQTAGRVVGVMAIQLNSKTEGLAPERQRLLEALASQSALAIERAYLVPGGGKNPAPGSHRKTGTIPA